MRATTVPDRFHNPFSTRRVRPGALPYHFAAGESATAIVDRLAAANWLGQIVGPHGSGKSTLLHELVPEIERRGRRVEWITLRDGQRRLPITWSQLAALDPKTVLIVDGCEQLAGWRRWRLARLCQRHGLGLLVTAHRPLRCATIVRTQTSPQLATVLAEELLAGDGSISAADVTERFAARQGNLRETLFDLYDLYESRRGPGV